MATRRTTAGRGTRKAPPAFVVPANMDSKTKRNVQRLIEHQLREAQGKPPPEIHPFRFRFQLVPLCWLAAAAAGLACRAGHAYALAVVASVVQTVVTVLCTRHRPPFPRLHTQGMSAWAAVWVVVLAFAGLGPWAALGLAGWAVPAGFWVHHYRWRGPAPAAAKPQGTNRQAMSER